MSFSSATDLLREAGKATTCIRQRVPHMNTPVNTMSTASMLRGIVRWTKFAANTT